MTLFQVKRIEREAKRVGREHPRASVIVSTSQLASGKGFACELSFCSAPTLEDMERHMIREAMEQNDGNLTVVARRLGITRQTLYNKIKRYGL